MDSRERFLRVCSFEPVDHPPRWDTLGFWYATVERWHEEGLPRDVSLQEYFDLDRRDFLPVNSGFTNCGYCPGFEREVLREDERTVTYRDSDGIVKRERKDRPELSMPQFLEFPVSGREDWEKIKWRLDPSTSERYPDWDEMRERYGGRDFALGMPICGGYGLPRNLFGEEHLAYMYYDDPGLIHDIMEHWVGFYRGIMDRVLPNTDLDYIYIWEDMAFKNGPLIGPKTFREFILPYYKEVISRIHELGVRHVLVDSDGNNDLLLDLFIEAGVNVFFPLEIAAGMDPLRVRRKYGSKLVLWGGIDKRVLAQDKQAIECELKAKVPPLLESGGYIPAIDHLIPPDVPLENYLFFKDLLRDLTGR